MTANERAYMAMLSEAVKQGMPQAYKDDLLFHDRLILGLYRIPEPRRTDGWEVEEGRAFGWILREHGTEIFQLCHDKIEFRSGAFAAGRYYGIGAGVKTQNPNLFYFWDGDHLHACESWQALDNMATEHYIAMMLRATI
jgi:hypothetical protein